MPANIVEFYAGQARDSHDRSIHTIFRMRDDQMESVHNYIQWLFPLHEESQCVEGSPVLTFEDVNRLRSNPTAIENMKAAINKFRYFLGLPQMQRVEADYDQPRGNFNESKVNTWCQDGNHNLLRVTRAIRSIRLFGLVDEAEEFYADVLRVARARKINRRTLQYWERAARDDVFASLR